MTGDHAAKSGMGPFGKLKGCKQFYCVPQLVSVVDWAPGTVLIVTMAAIWLRALYLSRWSSPSAPAFRGRSEEEEEEEEEEKEGVLKATNEVDAATSHQ